MYLWIIVPGGLTAIRSSWGDTPPSNVIATFVLEIILYIERVLWEIFLVLFCVGGLIGEGYFFGFLLFDITFQSEILANVLKAVTKPAQQLMYTALLICIVIFVFGLVALYWFGSDFLSFQLPNGVLTFFFNAMYDVMLPGTAMVVTSQDEFV